jgi:hypothetical protein
MFTLKGTLKKETIREFTRKDGTQGQSRELYIEPEGSLYPVKVNVSNMDLKIGKEGDVVTLKVEVFPYTFVDKQRKKAFLDVYVPNS